jgi:uncharacterized membrane protein YfcA
MIAPLLAVPLGLLVGVTLGAVGGGGSILTVPALIYALGEDPRNATTGSLVIVGLTAVTETMGHARAGRVRWVPGLVFGVIGVGGSVIGSRLNKLVEPNVLLLAFAGLMLLAAAAMLRRSAQRRSMPTSARPAAGRGVTGKRILMVAVVGTVVGFLTGFFGVGGGFIVVPGLVLALDFGMAEAVGTSLLVIGLNSAIALGARGGVTAVDWHVVLPFAVTAMAGSMLGNRVAGRFSAPVLERIFAGLLMVLSGYVATRSILRLV